MKSIKIAAILSFLSVLVCCKSFDDYANNPNTIAQPEPELLFNTSVRGTMNFYGGEFNRVVMFNYTQMFVAFQGRFQRYASDITPLSNYWRDNYTQCLMPCQQIIDLYDDKPAYANRVLIAKIWKCYLLSQITAIWGPIPYENGLHGNLSTPYNREQDIYYMLLDDLKNLGNAINIDGDYLATDAIFGMARSSTMNRASDLVKWKKFANTLRLRLAMRISNPAPNGDPGKAQEVVEEVFAQEALTMSTNADNAYSKWDGVNSTDGGNINPLHTYAVYNRYSNRGTLPAFGETAHYHMAPYGDPRLPVYAQPVVDKKIDETTPTYAGQYIGDTGSYGGSGGESGLKPTTEENIHKPLGREDYSPIGSRFVAADASFTFLSYAESCFLKAEAKLKGWGSSSAKIAEDYYNEGIKASMSSYSDQIKAADVDRYMETPGIKWGTATKTTDDDGVDISTKFMDWLKICSSIIKQNDHTHQIIMQHWLAIPNQGVDMWTLMRRTQVLQFEPCFSPYEGLYKYLPYRLEYPVTELSYNKNEVNKAINEYLIPRNSGTVIFRGNNMYVKLWFALPNKPIDVIPNPTDFL